MVETLDLIRKYLATCKEHTGMSWSDLSAITKLPDSTIRKIFSGETADPRLETISLIVSAMGGSLDAMLSGTIDEDPPKEEDSELSALILLRESYEKRIATLQNSSEQFMQSLKKDKMRLFTIVCILAAFLVVFLVMDLTLGSVGWIRYYIGAERLFATLKLFLASNPAPDEHRAYLAANRKSKLETHANVFMRTASRLRRCTDWF